ncbi:MAG: arginine deiminase family protein [Cytophagales bacterium]|nr:arginine deiminase family protein [Cytophagales bacterium]MDW8383263.1 arginine deiminase family protein [Flammeovirgaceae bacterium]
MFLNVHNETDTLKAVIVGTALDGRKVSPGNNPKVREHIEKGTMPTEEQLQEQLDEFCNVLQARGVTVFRPQNLPETGQIFTRDLGFVIGNTFVKGNLLRQNRRVEYEGLQYIVQQIPESHILIAPEEIILEGGDIVLYNQYVFVGIGDRTQEKGYQFLKEHFEPQKQVIPLYIRATDDPRTNVLHLDCAFQPVGKDCAIIYEEGFVKRPDILYQLFPSEKLIRVSSDEMYEMFPNIFSISPSTVVIERNFRRLRDELHKRNINTLEVSFDQVSKLGGLLRCSTLPLKRTP